MQGRFLFLGTGGSMGVPVIGCPCAVCHSSNTANQRSRSSGLITLGKKTFLIDAGPDFRSQALRFKVNHLDGVLLTHHHFDHIGGVDDLRIFYLMHKRSLLCLLSAETMEEIKARYHYLLKPKEEGKTLSAQLDFRLLPDQFGVISFEGVKFQYMTFSQAGTPVTGYRIGDLAYISDIREYTEDLLISLRGVKTLILSALRQEPTRMHFSVKEALAFAHLVGAEKTYLTHIAHDLDHEAINAELPSYVALGYDGLDIPFEIAPEHLV